MIMHDHVLVLAHSFLNCLIPAYSEFGRMVWKQLNPEVFRSIMHGMLDKLQSAKQPGLSSRWQQNPVGGTWQFVLPTLLPSASHLISLMSQQLFQGTQGSWCYLFFPQRGLLPVKAFTVSKQEQLFWFASCLKNSYKVVITCQSSVPWTQAEWLGMDGGRVDPSPQRFAWDLCV